MLGVVPSVTQLLALVDAPSPSINSLLGLRRAPGLRASLASYCWSTLQIDLRIFSSACLLHLRRASRAEYHPGPPGRIEIRPTYNMEILTHSERGSTSDAWVMYNAYAEQYRHGDTFLYDAMFCTHDVRRNALLCVLARRALPLRFDCTRIVLTEWRWTTIAVVYIGCNNPASLGLNTSNAIEKRKIHSGDPGVCALPGRRQSRISV
ncbi:hypothetical protein BJ912DRAFT_1068107 [Pholiota molesta]|nr:hypothetical protein BJ912DRAFT_1068107 [Pholiota molesta]